MYSSGIPRDLNPYETRTILSAGGSPLREAGGSFASSMRPQDSLAFSGVHSLGYENRPRSRSLLARPLDSLFTSGALVRDDLLVEKKISGVRRWPQASTFLLSGAVPADSTSSRDHRAALNTLNRFYRS